MLGRVRGRRDSARKSARKEGQWEKECEEGGTVGERVREGRDNVEEE